MARKRALPPCLRMVVAAGLVWANAGGATRASAAPASSSAVAVSGSGSGGAASATGPGARGDESAPAASTRPPERAVEGGASPVPPTAETAAAAPPAPPGDGTANRALAEPAVTPRVVVTGDLVPGESDHDAVVGGWGIEVRPVATTLPVFSRRAGTGCPTASAVGGGTETPTGAAAGAAGCPPVSVSMLSVRHWVTRNLAWTVGAALAFGGGSQNGRLLDTYFGIGPAAGLSILLGNWRHLTVAASPALSLVWFKAAGSAATTYVADLRADLEGEVHFGFVGLPALSLSMRSGMLLRLEKSAELAMWSAGVSGSSTLRGLVSDLTLRYYF